MKLMNAVKDIIRITIKALPGRGYEVSLPDIVICMLNAPERLKIIPAEDLEFFLELCRGHGLSFRFTR